MSETSYEESRNLQKRESDAAFGQSIVAKLHQIESCGIAVRDLTIDTANLTIRAGEELRAMMDKQQMKFEQFEGFFRAHAKDFAGAPEWFNSYSAKKLLHIARMHTEQITDLKTALVVLEQATFFAAGLMEEPKRALIQTATGDAPLHLFMNSTGKIRELLEKYGTESIFTTRADWQTFLDETEQIASLRETARGKV